VHPQATLVSRISAPGVSILRPLKGLDPNLYENLESTYNQEYPNFEIIFSVAEEDDHALPVVRDLMSRYPKISTRIIVGEEIVGVNPKINNLVRAYRQAANDILWVLDSNVMVDSRTLARSVDVLLSPLSTSHKKVALVHHVPFAVATESRMGSRIEEAFLNTNHAKMYIAINTVAIESCVVGKSNLYRRSDLERLTGSLEPISLRDGGARHRNDRGLTAFGRYLAEDNMIASALWHELGHRHDLAYDVVRNVVGHMTVSDYIWRRVRWIRVRKHMVLIATLVEPFTEALVLSAIACGSVKYLFGVPLHITLILHFSLLLWVDLDVYTSLAGSALAPAARRRFIAAWAVREALALPIYLLAIFGDEVVWRGKRYRVLRGGEVRHATPSCAES